MYSKVLSSTLSGVEGLDIGVEVDVGAGLPVFDLVGYLSSEVKEARERVRTALKNSGFTLPAKRITVNLSPADLRKEGSAFDLAIAVAILTAVGVISQQCVEQFVVLGELGLNGEVRHVNGILPMVSHAGQSGIQNVIVPAVDVYEAAVVRDVRVYGMASLEEVVAFFSSFEHDVPKKQPTVIQPESLFASTSNQDMDFADICGQTYAKRGLEIAAAGFHNILMTGPPGAGKSMMARSLPSILPHLTLRESIDITKIYSVKGLLKEGEPLVTKRPFRAPHHTVSQFALTGGGRNPLPGEMSLAHNGVLFLDELPEFKRDAIEVMRQPLEEGQVTISRVYAAYTFPADFMLVAAMNPCPCGYYPDRRRCQCSPPQIHRYLSKVSQPMLDRIDLCVQTRAVPFEQLKEHGKEESSAVIRERVRMAHQRQEQRYRSEDIVFNSQLSVRQVALYCALKPTAEAVVMDAVSQYELSTRAYHRILKVARTIADLADSEEIREEHLLEALAYHNSNLSDWNTYE